MVTGTAVVAVPPAATTMFPENAPTLTFAAGQSEDPLLTMLVIDVTSIAKCSRLFTVSVMLTVRPGKRPPVLPAMEKAEDEAPDPVEAPDVPDPASAIPPDPVAEDPIHTVQTAAMTTAVLRAVRQSRRSGRPGPAKNLCIVVPARASGLVAGERHWDVEGHSLAQVGGAGEHVQNAQDLDIARRRVPRNGRVADGRRCAGVDDDI